MRIRQLRLRPYRNFRQLQLDIGPRGALIVGANGTGKSNILESITYLSIGKSIRGARDLEAVPHEGQYFIVEGTWEDGERRWGVRVFFSSEHGKHAYLDEAPLRRVSELVSRFHTVHFSPEDVTRVLRFSAHRRRLLDVLLSQASSAYLESLQRYSHALTQRNHHLRDLRERGSDPVEKEVWDGQLVTPGAFIRRARLESLVDMAPIFCRYYRSFSMGREGAGVRYRGEAIPESRSLLPSRDELEADLHQELREQGARERRAGYTLSGPHRDLFEFTLEEAGADTYGSQGELKSILISWKLAELRFLERCRGQQPVLLLDDPFSELDEMRSQQLLSLTEDLDQVIVTAPRVPADDLAARFERIELR